MEKEVIIRCVEVSKRFNRNNRETLALQGVNIQIEQGECIVFQGRSGAGKSTLLNLMSGLEKPSSGRIFLDGTEISCLGDHYLSAILREKTGFIFQNFNLLPTYTIFENIEIAFLHKKQKTKNRKENIYSLLSQFGLSGLEDAYPYELSMGQQQKTAIVRCLAREPQIIFADEPTGSVDPEAAAEISQYLAGLNLVHGITVVIASHGLFDTSLADRTVHIENGTILQN